MSPAMEREYFSVGGGHGTSNILKLPIGSMVGVGYYHEGMRFAAGKILRVTEQVTQVDKKTKEETVVTQASVLLRIFPYADKPRKIRLAHTEERRGVYGWEHVLCVDGSHQEYLLSALTEQEIQTTQRWVLAEEEEPVVELTPKEVAKRLMGVITEEPRSAKKLARLANLEYDEVVVAVLGKLREAGMIKRVKVVVEDTEVRRWKVA